MSELQDVKELDKFIQYIMWRDFRGLSRADKEDIVQDVYYYLYRNQKKVTLWYLSTLVRNRAIDFLRKRKHIGFLDCKSLDDGYTSEEDALEGLLPFLDNRERLILELLEEGYTQVEIASELNVSQPYVSMLINDLFDKIKKLLDREE